MKPPETEDPLDALLRDGEDYVEDCGFTRQVIARLPAPRPRWLRSFILLGVALVGFMLLYWWQPPFTNFIVEEPQGGWALQFSYEFILAFGALLIALASLICGILSAIKWED